MNDVSFVTGINWVNSRCVILLSLSGIMFRRNNISSFYQPDGIKYFEVDGIGYIITASEGDTFEFELGNEEWAEDQRGNTFEAGKSLQTYIL